MFMTLDVAMVSQRWNQSMSNQKKNKLISSKLISFLQQKIPRSEKPVTEKKISAHCTSDKSLLSRIHHELVQCNKTTSQFFKWMRDFKTYKCSTSTWKGVTQNSLCIHGNGYNQENWKSHVAKDAEELEPLTFACGNVKCAVCVQQPGISS